MPHYHDLKDQQLGNLQIIEIAQHNPIFWKCKCTCGNFVNVRASHLKKGKTKSCGCLRKTAQWTGYGEISGDYYRSLKDGAASRCLEFNVSIQELWTMFLAQNRKCAYSKLPINFRTGRNKKDQTASLDRKNTNQGYIQTNVHWVHKDINRMKQNFSEERFFELCQSVTSNCSGYPVT